MQSLLEERFQMATHWETRDLPVYALVVATEGKLGPKLQGACRRLRSRAQRRPASTRIAGDELRHAYRT